jgi:glycosyltransferase involved in cell wall biosynthesis
MNVLFLHQNFPGQFLHVAQALKQRGGGQLVAITDKRNTRPDLIPTIRYAFDQSVIGRPHSLGVSYTSRAARGAVVAQAMARLKASGFAPDLIIGHPGWGETLFVKDVWPNVPLIAYAEFYYGGKDSDAGFDPEFREQDPLLLSMRLRAKNAAQLQALHDADVGVSPTHWQGGRFPASLKRKIAVIHEGVDTNLVAPKPSAAFQLPNGGPLLRKGDEVVTFVNRNLEPYRGFHIFMRALPDILAARPNAQVVIVGGSDLSYGPAARDGTNWKEIFLAEVEARLPMQRVHFVGMLPYDQFLSLMQISSAHVYLTYPFVLSWSMLEAMSASALVARFNDFERGRSGRGI